MKREIKFRGLRTDGKGWVYGDLVKNHLATRIVEDFTLSSTNHNGTNKCGGNFYLVTPESVGQFTGLKDKNGVEIYEGDILSCEYWEGENYIVKYEQDDRWIGYWYPKYDSKRIEIISNIHQN